MLTQLFTISKPCAITLLATHNIEYGGEGRGSRNQGVVILVCDDGAG